MAMDNRKIASVTIVVEYDGEDGTDCEEQVFNLGNASNIQVGITHQRHDPMYDTVVTRHRIEWETAMHLDNMDESVLRYSPTERDWVYG